jgi:hypothetical protein
LKDPNNRHCIHAIAICARKQFGSRAHTLEAILVPFTAGFVDDMELNRMVVVFTSWRLIAAVIEKSK